MTTLIRSDLEFILAQIRIAEQNAGYTAAPVRLDTLIANPLLPDGLRLVNGTFNNLLNTQENFGAADQVFPRMLTPRLRSGDLTLAIDPDGPGPAGVLTPGVATSYIQTSGYVFDSQPRLASNLVVDQTATNPSAVAAWRVQNPGPDGLVGTLDDPAVPATGTLFIENVATDVGLSAPYNSWFTLFGQFFDHGLDLTNKGGAGTVIMTLPSDDPLRARPDVIAGVNDFMTLTRATVVGSNAGVDGDIGTEDDVRDNVNQTTPFVDQNQTYTSHPSHQVFLREYVLVDGPDVGTVPDRPVSTGRLIDGVNGGIGNWGEVKAQAATMLGITLADTDVLNVPMLLTDEYGRFIPGPLRGMPQVVFPGNVLVEGNTAVPISVVGSVKTGHAFLDDIAHTAVPRTGLTADGDALTGNPQVGATYDNELLARHFVTGDGRGNENIGLTAVHTVFHAEHNRLVQHIKDVALATNDAAHLNEWLLTDVLVVPTTPAAIAALNWDGQRLFQAARFGTEMQYQHLVFEEFARKIQPEVNVFAGYGTDINPAIMAEFAHVVYRLGHSMLTETVDRIDVAGADTSMGLIEAFLNPVAFDYDGTVAPAIAAGNIVRGMTRQTGNELDEFVTDALRNNLLGLPLDLPTINMARGRDTGIPGLNAARRMFFDDTAAGIGRGTAGGNSALAPYESWADFGLNLKHIESLVNFVAAYGTHGSITGDMAARRAAAAALMDPLNADGVAFMSSTGIYANLPNGATTTGLDDVDFWLGGLAEKQFVFGGLLGSTFNYVFETQMEALQDGDRLYYLSRTAGLNFLTELEGNSFAALIERNLPGVKHLPGDVFSTPAFTVEVGNMGATGPILDDAATPFNEAGGDFIRMADGTIRYIGVEHIVMGGTPGNDRMRASEGDDTLHGDEGNDRLEGGDGNDILIGGIGDDIITDSNGVDNIKGGDGNDVISSGAGLGDLNLAGAGNDYVLGGSDPSETFGGRGDDFVFAGDSFNTVFGNEGDDWIEGGGQADLLQGDMGDPFQASTVVGNDIIIGGSGNDDYDSESGDDIMVSDGGTERHEGMLGFDWVTYKGDTSGVNADMFLTGLLPPLPPADALRDRFDLVEGLSGWRFNDILRGTSNTAVELGAIDVTSGFNNALNNAAQIGLITGLQAQLGAGVTSFNAGDIILGGDGSDLMEGRGGNDIIDGDAWLNVRINIMDLAGTTVIGNAESMKAVLTNKAGTLAGTPATLTLQAAMLAGTLNPGQLRMVREIVSTADTVPDIDTVLFRDVFAAYTITLNGDGSRTVAHTTPTVAAIDDGIDTVRNVERLQFTDQIVSIAAVNTPATGAPTISDITPTETQAITVSLAGVIDANGVPAAFTAQWRDAQGDIPGATALTFTPGAGQVNEALSVRVSFTDNAGFAETLTSALTTVVGDFVAGAGGAQTLNGNAGSDLLNGGGGGDTINGNAGDDTLNGDGGNDTVNGGAGNDTINGGTGTDTLNGGADNDTINGGADNDEIAGNAGVDTMDGGAGADDFNYTLLTDTGVGVGLRDIINNFLAGTDDLDFSVIDANTTIGGNQAFIGVGTGPFTAPGQVRVVQDGLNTLVQANVDANLAPDFEVQLNNIVATTLTIADLIP